MHYKTRQNSAERCKYLHKKIAYFAFPSEKSEKLCGARRNSLISPSKERLISHFADEKRRRKKKRERKREEKANLGVDRVSILRGQLLGHRRVVESHTRRRTNRTSLAIGQPSRSAASKERRRSRRPSTPSARSSCTSAPSSLLSPFRKRRLLRARPGGVAATTAYDTRLVFPGLIRNKSPSLSSPLPPPRLFRSID